MNKEQQKRKKEIESISDSYTQKVPTLYGNFQELVRQLRQMNPIEGFIKSHDMVSLLIEVHQEKNPGLWKGQQKVFTQLTYHILDDYIMKNEEDWKNYTEEAIKFMGDIFQENVPPILEVSE